jgi:hypothetical protein
MYEPLWDEIEERSRKLSFRIRAVWIADMWNQGQSGSVNEDVMGKDRKSVIIVLGSFTDFA